jgi:hypothetical protein
MTLKATSKASGPVKSNPEWEQRAKEALARLAKHKHALVRKPRSEQ